MTFDRSDLIPVGILFAILFLITLMVYRVDASYKDISARGFIRVEYHGATVWVLPESVHLLSEKEKP
jgi:hypothetical protein